MPRRLPSRAPSTRGWSTLLSSSPSRDLDAVLALRGAQTAALALLREVVRGLSDANRRPGAPAQEAPSSVQEVSSSVQEVPSSVQEVPSFVQEVPSSAEGNVAPAVSAPAVGSGNIGRATAAAVTGTAASGGARSPPAATAVPAADVGDEWGALRRALLQRTPLLAGLARCLVGGSAATSAPGAVGGDQGAGQGAAERVVHEACATLRCLLSCEAGDCLLPDGGGSRSEIPQAVFHALEGVLGQEPSEEDEGASIRWGGGGCGEAVKARLPLVEVRHRENVNIGHTHVL